MRKIEMVDLKGQYEKIRDQINSSVLDVIDSTAFINGPEVQQFQKELEQYLGVKHVIPCANGTDALQIALMGLGLKPGDEVITADFTFAATVEVIGLLQLTPVLVDVEPGSFNIDPQAVKSAITPRTKAIIPVHLFGQPANMEDLMEIARENDLYIVEDNAQAIGANYHFGSGQVKKAGTIGDIGTTSFFPSKNLGCYGDGGAIFTNDDRIANFIRGIVNHGMYERYHHDVVGVNSRLDSIQAAILRRKLPFLDEYNNSRRSAARKYNKALEDHPVITTPAIPLAEDSHVFHQYTLRISGGKRDALVQHLNGQGIPCGIYYPIPLHNQKAYMNSRNSEEDFPVTNTLVQEVVSLPMHSELDEEQVEFISGSILDFLKGH